MKRTIILLAVQFVINHFLCVTRFFALKRFLLNLVKGISIGAGTRIVGPVHITGNLIVGNNTWIGNEFCVEGNGTVIIGDNCDIAPQVTCFTGGHIIDKKSRRAGKGINKEIVIGKGSWICGRSTILPGKNIGIGCVVAAGAVVATNIPDNVLAGGVLAKVIRQLDDTNG